MGESIPEEVLARLGQRGETHGKAGGSGLGLHHARTSVESWGGRLELASEVGKGTKAALVLPLAPEPGWFASAIARERHDAVLIDDDSLARMTWEMTGARLGKKLRSYESAGDFLKEADGIDRATPVYVDSDLGDGVKGEVEALAIRGLGFGEIYLTTGHRAENFAGLAYLRGVVGKEPPWRLES